MKRNLNLLLWATALIVVTAVFPGCTPKEAPKPAAVPAAESTTVAAAPVPKELQGLVTFITGEAKVKNGDTWTVLDIGKEVALDSVVATGADGTCEIQFAEFGSVQLSPSTTLVVRHLVADETHTSSELELTTGKVICKVRKLTGDDQFRVRTREMVCGVRGTCFLVSASENKPTKIAVQEGSVVVLPPSIDPVALAEEAVSPEKQDLIRNVMDELSEATPVLTAGEERQVTAKDMAKADAVIKEIVAEIKSSEAPAVSADATSSDANAPTVELPENLTKKLETYQAAAKIPASAVVPIKAATKADFAAASTLEIRKIPEAAPAATSDTSAATPAAPALTSLIVRVDPADAEVSVNGTKLARGNFSGLFSQGETISVSVKKTGYTDYAEDISIAGGEPVTRDIKLEAVKAESPAAPAAKPEKAKPEGPVSWEELKPATTLATASSSKILYVSPSGDGKFYASDAKSGISALGAKGQKLWSGQTENGLNTNSPAVVAGSYVAFAGDKTLSVLDSAGGKLLWSVALDKTNSCIFGRHPAMFGGTLYASSNDGLLAFNLADGKSAGSLAIADGSDMSPSISGKTLYIVSKIGTFYAIDPANLSVKASLATGAMQPVATEVVVLDGKAYFVDRKGMVTSVKTDASSIVWQKKLSAEKSVEVFSDPIVTSSGVYITAKGTLYALSAASGDPLFPPVSGITSTVCAVKKSLWCGMAGNMLAELNSANGKVIRQITLPAVVSGPPVYSGGILAAPLANGQELLVDLAALP
jgi:hypothetical protein